jgi:hypothetical protein
MKFRAADILPTSHKRFFANANRLALRVAVCFFAFWLTMSFGMVADLPHLGGELSISSATGFDGPTSEDQPYCPLRSHNASPTAVFLSSAEFSTVYFSEMSFPLSIEEPSSVDLSPPGHIPIFS